MHRSVDDHFFEHTCAREQKRDNDPEQGQLFFCGSRIRFFYRRSLSTSGHCVK